jgi:hypothetical protein
MLKLRHPVSLLAICLLVMLGVMRSFSPPSPVGADAPDVVFSAIRAEAILRELLAENRPHVTGSEMNARVRDRVLAHLESAGYQPEIQSRFQCNPVFGSCSPVENIIAVKPGTDGSRALLVTSHYDSGWAGPGAADAGAAVAAVLEIARMAADYPPYTNDIIFLFTDSEENGLIGARAFADHHPLFGKVRAVINLEARGVTGPSTMFETGDGNRSIIRIYSKNVERPSANSLVYEIYKTMPNDTDYSVYKGEGVMGLNFAFARGVALYHSLLDDPDHLDLGSLQHHGDNAWGLLNALGDRDLNRIVAREDAGYIDVFSSTLIHYPVAITEGLALFLGIWVMIAVAAAFRREFRYRQLRWGILAIPLMGAAVLLSGYLLAWPLGHWQDLHPLEHPYPWVGRTAMLLALLIVVYASLKLFTGRVSACAWMILAWLTVFGFTMMLTSRLPSAAHIGLIPLAAFALGSLVDLFRKKSPAPLLVASVAGFTAAAFISWYHFFLLGSVFNFHRSGLLIAPLLLMALVSMPMLLAFVSRLDLDWWPAKWLAVALLGILTIQFFTPGFTAERPRDMSLMYQESDGVDSGFVVLESRFGTPDRDWARKHLFENRSLDTGRLGTADRLVREVDRLDLPGIEVSQSEPEEISGKWSRRLEVRFTGESPVLFLAIPLDSGLLQARVNGELALDVALESKRKRSRFGLRLVHPGSGPLDIELVTDRAAPFRMEAVTWQDLPSVLLAPFMGYWPGDAQPYYYGPRAEKIQAFEVR